MDLKQGNRLLYECLKAAALIAEQVTKETGQVFTSEDVRAIGITRYIEANRSGN